LLPSGLPPQPLLATAVAADLDSPSSVPRSAESDLPASGGQRPDTGGIGIHSILVLDDFSRFVLASDLKPGITPHTVNGAVEQAVEFRGMRQVAYPVFFNSASCPFKFATASLASPIRC
jgi:hypothetical protein